jgi:D-serine deaminase-like pyridoxal phosphate-dependent protein
LADLATPCLVLDANRMDRNIARLRSRLDGLGVALRPHLKTGKSVDVAQRVMTSPTGPAAVSTLREAEQFVAAGVRDIIYAAGIAPSKLSRVLALRAQGADVAVVLDTMEQAQAVAQASRAAGKRIQEHGIITVRPGSGGVLPDLAIGERVRILPNHACATSAQHHSYHVVRGGSDQVEAEWPRFGGWK